MKAVFSLYLFCFFSFLFSQNNYAQNNDNNSLNLQYKPYDKISFEKLLEDYKIFRKTLEEIHPSLYRYTPKQAFEAKFDSVQALLNREMTEIEFYALLAYLVAQIQDGHTEIKPSLEYRLFLKTKALLFPFYLTFIDEKAYIVLNGSKDTNINIGSEVMSINGKSIKEIMQKIYSRLSSDSNIQSRKKWLINQTFSNYFHYFIGLGKEFSMLIRNQTDEKLQIKNTEALPYSDIFLNFKTNFRNHKATRFFNAIFENEANPLKVEFIKNQSAALLTVATFMDFKKQKFPDFLKDAFHLIQIYKSKNLIIDLRNNGGGKLDYAKLLFAYLSEEDFKAADSTFWNGGNITYKEFTNIRLGEKFDKSLENLKKYFVSDSLGTYKTSELNNENFSRIKKSLKSPFSGKVYFIINGGTFSATNLFSVLSHHYKRGIFIGEESGGNYYESTGNFATNALVLKLPNSHLETTIPTARFIWSVSGYPHRDRGLIPDYPVLPKIRDLVYGEDTVLNFVLDLINLGK